MLICIFVINISQYSLKNKIMQKAQTLLKKYELRSTEARRAVLRVFLGWEHALTHGNIEKALDLEVDRVTLYRTLKTFEDSGLIHRIADDTDVIRYALCKEDCDHDQHKHTDNHVHFKCEKCEKTMCLDGTEIPNVQLPNGYRADRFQFLVIGVCKACS